MPLFPISLPDILTVDSVRYMLCFGGLGCFLLGISMLLRLLLMGYRRFVHPARPQVYVLWKRDGGWGEERPITKQNKEE